MATPEWLIKSRERRERAVEAATKVAAAHGVRSAAPVILKDSNNTVVHLAPAPVVAKVSTSTLRRPRACGLGQDLDVALHLSRAGAPVVPPSDEIPPAVYRHEGLEVIFWQHCPGDARDETDSDELLAAVEQFHAAFADYRGPLGTFTEVYEECRAILDGDRLSAELSAADRELMRRAYDRLSARLQTFDCERVPAHMELHPGNVLWLGARPLLIDFESCCLAPREIDFLLFSERRLSARPDLDGRLIEVLRDLQSFCVAAWCWTQPERAPEVREAAEYHLGRLRGLR